MKEQYTFTVQAVNVIALDTVEMVLNNSEAALATVPGQFLHILVEGHSLRRPISIANVDKKQGTITLLFKKVGDGTRKLATYQPGMTFKALGPNGNGFTIVDDVQTVLLIGGGIGVPPLYCLGKALREKGVSVKAILGFQTAEHVFYEQAFQSLGETWITTDDGSYGHSGFVTDILSETGAFDLYYTCGPTPMLKAVTMALADKQGYVSLEERMGCGIGACYACVVPAHNEAGYYKVCQDGPVFPANEVVLV